MNELSIELRAALERIARFEASLKPTSLGALAIRLGPTRPFAEVYRRLGPKLDPLLLRSGRGELAKRLTGLPALLLITRGRKTGAPRTSPLLYVRDADAFAIVGTNFGTEHHPAWTYNLLHAPSAEIEVAGERLQVQAELLDAASFAALWPRFVAVYPGYDAYLTRLTHRQPRMFRLRPTAVSS